MAKRDEKCSAEFVGLLTRHQSDLSAFIQSLMPGHPDVPDVVQKTNMVLWKKRDAFEEGSDFLAWALTCARFTVMGHLQRLKSKQIVLLDDELLDRVASQASENLGSADHCLAALEHCLGQLRPQDRELVTFRYWSGRPLCDYAGKVGRSVSALSVTLHRVRDILRRCINRELSAGGGGEYPGL